MQKFFIIIVLLGSIFIPVTAKEIVVANDQDSGSGSFRDAVLQASDGDNITFGSDFTIFLKTAIELGNKTLMINGLSGGNRVILDGSYLDADNDTIDDDGIYTRIFTIIGEPDKVVNLWNLVIQHGSTDRENTSSDNWPVYKGGGMYIDMTDGGTFSATNCLIQNNILARRENGYDGANQVYLSGAGVYSRYGGIFADCTIKNNTCIAKNSYQCNYEGGGACIQKFGSFSNCLIAGNRLLFEPINNENFFNAVGAGLCLYSRAVVENCVIVGNVIENISDELQGYFNNAIGAGIISASGSVFNSSIICNGIYNIDVIPEQQEDFPVACGGAFLGINNDDETANYQNNLIYGNYCSSGEYHDGVSVSDYTKYTAFSDASDFDYSNPDETSILLEKNPFVALPSAGEDGTWGTDDDFYGDLRLIEDAPCIDAGNPDESQFSYLLLDFYGRARINKGRIDIGALEFYASDETYSLRGMVHAGDSPVVGTEVQAIGAGNTDQIIASVKTGEDGAFEFPSLVPGEYLFYAVSSDDSPYFSTYFGNETDLDKAIPINVDDIIYDVDIHLVSKIITKTDHKKALTVKVFPNPASEVVNITGVENIQKIILYDSFRSEVEQFNGDLKQISLAGIQPGFYIISIVTEKQTFNRQLIIKN